jgi:hypothetical protein
MPVDNASFEGLPLELSASLAGLDAATTHRPSKKPLAHIVTFLDIDAALVGELQDQGGLRATHSWRRPGVGPTAVDGESVPWLVERVRAGSVVESPGSTTARPTRLAIGQLFLQQQAEFGAYSRNGLSLNRANRSAAMDTSFSGWQLGFDASSELDVWGRLRRGIEAGDAQLVAAAATYDDVPATPGLGGGWERRAGRDFAPDETKRRMHWGDVLETGTPGEDLDAAPSGTESDRDWWRWRAWWPQ